VDLSPEDAVRIAGRTGCRAAPPPLDEVWPDQWAACCLYQDRPVKADVGEWRALPLLASA